MKRVRFWVVFIAVLTTVAIFGFVVAYATGMLPSGDPRSPTNIRQSTDITLLVPSDTAISLADWRSNDEAVTYTATVSGRTVIVTLQKVPLQYRDDEAAYERFVGSLKPFAVFEVPLGRVALINLVEESSFAPNGQSAVLNAKGTLLVARPEGGTMGQDDWTTLFDSMRAEP